MWPPMPGRCQVSNPTETQPPKFKNFRPAEVCLIRLIACLTDSFWNLESVASVPRRTVNPWKAPPYGAVASGVAVAWSGAQQLGPIQRFSRT